ncbi:MAG TPA: hypothetical protein VEW65_13750 [Chryseolinea sp.]|jgi:hypothetical protein|nr:hypothetical protein [Chryseolinea sp.]
MNYKDINKDERIKLIVNHLVDKFGETSFKLKDHWDQDLNAIGLADNEDRYLIYISSYGENNFYVSLEKRNEESEVPYEPAGDFDNVDLEELEKIFVKHLRIKTTHAQ